jgi:hypothetical protein
MLCVIQKQFDGPGNRHYTVGELVDASEWRLRDKLIEGRYMRPATDREVASAEEVDVPEKPVRKRSKR